jgi:hypothetical protein
MEQQKNWALKLRDLVAHFRNFFVLINFQKSFFLNKKPFSKMPKGWNCLAPPTKRFSNFLHEG